MNMYKLAPPPATATSARVLYKRGISKDPTIDYINDPHTIYYCMDINHRPGITKGYPIMFETEIKKLSYHEHNMYLNHDRFGGIGVFAGERIPAFAVVFHYAGDEMNIPKIMRGRVKGRRRKRTITRTKEFSGNRHYILSTSKKSIDATFFGNMSRFVNTDCQNPNTFIQEDDKGNAWLFALRDIQPHEEITTFYGTYETANGEPEQCESCHQIHPVDYIPPVIDAIPDGQFVNDLNGYLVGFAIPKTYRKGTIIYDDFGQD